MPIGVYKHNPSIINNLRGYPIKGKHQSKETIEKRVDTRRKNNSYIHSDLTKQKISLGNKGKIRSKEICQKLSILAKRRGFGKWMNGRKLPKETIKKILITRKKTKEKNGYYHSPETIEKMRGHFRKHSEEAKLKMSIGHKGKPTWNKGKNMSDEYRKNISLAKQNISLETREKMRLAKLKTNPLWKEGVIIDRTYTIDWTETLRRSIRERDRYTCQICNKQQGDQIHSVHHIDYNKKNCSSENLITLCISCHMKTNTNRTKWLEYFKNKLICRGDL
jgi:hypothetical protein